MSVNGSKPKVCIIVNHENTILLFRKELIGELIRNNYDVYILLPSECEKEKIKALRGTVVPYSLSQHGTGIIQEIRSFRSISSILSSLRPEMVLTYTIKPNLYGGTVCRRKKIPYIATITGMGRGFEQNSVMNTILSLLLKFSLKKAKRVVFQNEPTKKYFSPRYIKEEQCVLVNGSGVDLTANSFEEYPENDLPELLFVGRVMGDKGIRELIKSVYEINSDEKRVHLTLVGPVEKDCEALATSVSDDTSFTFVGMKDQSEVHDYVKACDAVVVPSYHEGMCNSLLEAASAGRPVITTRIPGCMETFDEMKSGIGCEPRDAESLKDAILRFINLSKEQKKQMGINGRKKMENEFDRTKIIQKYITLIQE